jgi:hypothetical protein
MVPGASERWAGSLEGKENQPYLNVEQYFQKEDELSKAQTSVWGSLREPR